MYRSRHARRSFVAVVGSLLILSGLAPITTSPVRAISPDVVISEVYGGGGNSGATFTNDFMELYNRGTSAVSLTGWSVQYASATGSTWQVTALSGSIAPGGHFLVQQAAGDRGNNSASDPGRDGLDRDVGDGGQGCPRDEFDRSHQCLRSRLRRRGLSP